MILPRSDGVIRGHGPDSKARRAALYGDIYICLVTLWDAGDDRSPVAGFLTSKVLPEAAATHLPSISIFLDAVRNCVTGSTSEFL